MKIREVQLRINASYNTINTIKNFIESDSGYHEKIYNVLHTTKSGMDRLEEKYGLKAEILTDDNIHFYKNQIVFLRQ